MYMYITVLYDFKFSYDIITLLQQRGLGAENEVETKGRTGASEVDPENDRGVMETPCIPTGSPSLRRRQDLVVKATTSCPGVTLGLGDWHDLMIVPQPFQYCELFVNHIKRGLVAFHPY